MIALQLPHPFNPTRYCDTPCHESQHSDCDCICQGLLHGKGAAYAKANKGRVATMLRYQRASLHLSEYPRPNTPALKRFESPKSIGENL